MCLVQDEGAHLHFIHDVLSQHGRAIGRLGFTFRLYIYHPVATESKSKSYITDTEHPFASTKLGLNRKASLAYIATVPQTFAKPSRYPYLEEHDHLQPLGTFPDTP